jgi:hypothetical protein
MFVGAAGSPYAAFRRAIEARNLIRAITEGRDLAKISLGDAAELLVLATEQHQPSFDRWASRWAARYALENRDVTLEEAQLVLAALVGLRQPDRRSAAAALVAILRANGRRELARPFTRYSALLTTALRGASRRTASALPRIRGCRSRLGP